MTDIDSDRPVEIAPGTYWVGRREDTLLERNIFLRVFVKGGCDGVALLIDPGPPADLMALTKKVAAVIGDLRNVNLVFANHQDPDVSYNTAYLQKLNPNLTVLCSEDTWRLIRFYGLDPKRYFAVERFKRRAVKLATGHELRFVPTPFCHFRGATMLYDVETRILYTGDLFGGLSYTPSFWADERSWEGIKAFHQIYMPTQEAVALAVRNIRELDPPPSMLVPQHGGIIAGDLIASFLERLEHLPVGLNLLLDSQLKDNYIAAMNELLVELSAVVGSERIADAMKVFGADATFSSTIRADQKGIQDVKIDPRTAIEIFLTRLTQLLPQQDSAVEMAVIKVLLGRNIPLPENLRRDGAQSPAFVLE